MMIDEFNEEDKPVRFTLDEYKEEIIKQWSDPLFDPVEELARITNIYQAHVTLMEYEEADQYYERMNFLRTRILLYLISYN